MTKVIHTTHAQDALLSIEVADFVLRRLREMHPGVNDVCANCVGAILWNAFLMAKEKHEPKWTPQNQLEAMGNLHNVAGEAAHHLYHELYGDVPMMGEDDGDGIQMINIDEIDLDALAPEVRQVVEKIQEAVAGMPKAGGTKH